VKKNREIKGDIKMVLFLLGLMVLMNALAFTAIRFGMEKVPDGPILSTILKGIGNPLVLVGVGLLASGMLLYFYVLSKLELSIAYPTAIGLETIFVLACAWVFLKEPITFPHLIGIALILVGIILIKH